MNIVDWIFPKYCLGCAREGRYVCENCEKKIGVRGNTLRYEGVVRKIIKEIKFRGSYDMVKELVDLWWMKTGEIKIKEGFVVTAVPMWNIKKRIRGFNQAELIAREIAKRREIKYQEILERIRETKPMYGLDRKERSKNIYGAFQVKQEVTTIAKVVLVDDVWTTGSTFRECEKVLKKAGTKEIIRVIIAG